MRYAHILRHNLLFSDDRLERSNSDDLIAINVDQFFNKLATCLRIPTVSSLSSTLKYHGRYYSI